MFGIGAQEIIIILIVALIVVGPQRLPEVAGQVAKAIRDFRRMSDDLTGEFTRSLSLDDDKKANPLLTDEVITASSTPDQIGSSIAQSLRVETIPNESVTPALMAQNALPAETTEAQPTHSEMNEDTVISLAPVATKSAPLIGVSALDSDTTYVGTTFPAKEIPAASDYVYESSTVTEQSTAGTDSETLPIGAAGAVTAQNGISDAWDAVISTEATASPVVAEAAATDESAPDVIGAVAYTPPAREPVDPEAEPTIREKVESQVVAEAFRERRRIANYQRSRKRD